MPSSYRLASASLFNDHRRDISDPDVHSGATPRRGRCCCCNFGSHYWHAGRLPSFGPDEQRSPLDWRSLVKLGLFIAGLFILSALVQDLVGTKGISLVSFVGGLFELHGVTLATATLHAAQNLTNQEATLALLLAVVASFLSKLTILWTLSPVRFAGAMSAFLLLVLGAGGVTFIVML
jgi:uncharacterized membrane protein (DUF4010 family)